MYPFEPIVRSGRKYLYIEVIQEKVLLTTGQEEIRRPGGPGLMQLVSIDLLVLIDQFNRQAPERDVFTLTEIATFAHMKSVTVNSWIRAGVLTPSIRDRDGTRGKAMLFSRLDAFLACLVASLQRKCRLPLPLLTKVTTLLASGEARLPGDGLTVSGEDTSISQKSQPNPTTKKKRPAKRKVRS